MTDTLPAPDGFRYSTPIAIRYGDMDTLGHVNNAKYLTYLEQSRVSYARDLGLWDGSLTATGIILARAELDFRAPMTLDDGIATVWTHMSRIGHKSFEMTHVVTVDRGNQRIVTLNAKSVGVAYDYMQNATIAVPEVWRSAVASYEPLPLE